MIMLGARKDFYLDGRALYELLFLWLNFEQLHLRFHVMLVRICPKIFGELATGLELVSKELNHFGVIADWVSQ